MKSSPDPSFFKNKNVLITGGLGFIGSTLAIRLVAMGARVTIMDNLIIGHGGNPFNIEPVKKQVDVHMKDIRELEAMHMIVRDKDFIFHLAGQNDHILSFSDPFPDIDINIKGSAILLEACRKFNPNVRVVYTGTRGEYGPAAKLPVTEDDPINPKGIYELSSLTAQKLFKIYNDNHGIRSVTLRLTNIYGPRAQMRHDRFGVANWFVRQALDDATIRVFGDGRLARDFLYVDDAVEAILLSAACAAAYGEVFNVGRDDPNDFRALAESIVRIARRGRWELAPFPEERKAQEPGDFYSDITKIKNTVGWRPAVSLEDGLTRTIQYYRKHKKHYW